MEESNARQLTAAVALVDEAVLRERDTCEQLEREVAVANQARETAQRALASASANTAAAVAAARSGLANKLQAAQEAHAAELAKVCHHNTRLAVTRCAHTVLPHPLTRHHRFARRLPRKWPALALVCWSWSVCMMLPPHRRWRG